MKDREYQTDWDMQHRCDSSVTVWSIFAYQKIGSFRFRPSLSSPSSLNGPINRESLLTTFIRQSYTLTFIPLLSSSRLQLVELVFRRLSRTWTTVYRECPNEQRWSSWLSHSVCCSALFQCKVWAQTCVSPSLVYSNKRVFARTSQLPPTIMCVTQPLWNWLAAKA